MKLASDSCSLVPTLLGTCRSTPKPRLKQDATAGDEVLRVVGEAESLGGDESLH